MLKFLGIGSAFNTKLGNTSAYIKREDSILLFDCGCTVFHRLQETGLLNNVKNIYVALTHLHPDHCGSLGDLIFYAHYILKTKVHVIFPKKFSVQTLLREQGVEEALIDKVARRMTVRFKIPEMNIVLFAEATEHIPNKWKDHYGYTIYDMTDKTIEFYTGDCSQTPEQVLKFCQRGRITAIYHDTCGLDYEGNVHTSLRKLAEIFPPELRSKIYCMHIDSAFDRRKAKKLGFNVVKRETRIQIKTNEIKQKLQLKTIDYLNSLSKVSMVFGSIKTGE